MTAREIIEKMGDYSISSERIFEMVKTFIADKYNGFGNLIPPDEEDLMDSQLLHDAVTKLRPAVDKMLWRYIVGMDANCPVHGPIDIDALEKKLYPNN